jgi:hypothetical protein
MIYKISANQKQEFPMTMFLSNRNDMLQSYRGPSMEASCKIVLYLAKWFLRRFLEIDQPETRIVHGGHAC